MPCQDSAVKVSEDDFTARHQSAVDVIQKPDYEIIVEVIDLPPFSLRTFGSG